MRSGTIGTIRMLIGAACGGLLATALSAALAQTAAAPQPVPSQADQARLDEAMTRAIRPLRLTDGRLGDAGGAWLADRLTGADIVMIGETHGTGSIAQTAGALVDALPTDRPLAYALEISPTGAATQEPLLRGPQAALDAYMADPRTAISFAFLNLREEAALARKILARSKPRQGALWGLDQEFASSAPLLLDRLEGWAHSPAQKAAITAARSKSKPLMALIHFQDDVYKPLEDAFASGPKEARQLIADMRFSSEVYRLQEGTAANLSNRMREDYMKRNFLGHWRAAGKTPPRVVMKFGAYHLTAGLSPSLTPALGGFVHALALMEGKKALSVMIVCGPDGTQTGFRGTASGCREDFGETAGLFQSGLSPTGETLIDTAPLRLIPGTLRRLGVSEDIRNYINSYDAIIVLKDAKAATPFAQPLPAFFEGM